MAELFDAYRKWLGIPPEDQPPHHYRLLGIAPFESDPDVIDNAATRQMTHVRAYQASKHSALSQRILKDLSVAKLCLLTPERKEAYDLQLRARLAAEGKLPVAAQLPASVQPPAEAARAPLPPFPRATDIRWRLEEPALGEPTDLPAFPPVPIPMPDGEGPVAVPLVRQKPAAYLRARRKKNVLPALLIVGSLVVLIGGGAAAALLLSGRSLDRALDFQAAPAPVAPAPSRTE